MFILASFSTLANVQRGETNRASLHAAQAECIASGSQIQAPRPIDPEHHRIYFQHLRWIFRLWRNFLFCLPSCSQQEHSHWDKLSTYEWLISVKREYMYGLEEIMYKPVFSMSPDLARTQFGRHFLTAESRKTSHSRLLAESSIPNRPDSSSPSILVLWSSLMPSEVQLI